MVGLGRGSLNNTHVCMYVCIYIYIHIDRYMYVYVCKLQIYTYALTYVHIYMYIYMYTFWYIYIYTYMYKHFHTHTYLCVCMCVCTYTQIQICVSTPWGSYLPSAEEKLDAAAAALLDELLPPSARPRELGAASRVQRGQCSKLEAVAFRMWARVFQRLCIA